MTHRQDDWVDWLKLMMFTYNNTKHSSSGVSPFFTNHGFHPNLPQDVDLAEVFKILLEEHLEHLGKACEELEESL